VTVSRQLIKAIIVTVSCFTELPTTPEVYTHIQSILEMFDLFSLYMFILEILLKWVDNFVDFWSSGWNIFDFLVTIVVSYISLIEIHVAEMALGGYYY